MSEPGGVSAEAIAQRAAGLGLFLTPERCAQIAAAASPAIERVRNLCPEREGRTGSFEQLLSSMGCHDRT
ncbi:MAG TPA: hypothetical protein VEC35_20015 [Noviherbaspirillum sp.]|nr:hypothetical protein [Noviherbaspirillum sp.]